jgi:hypothetical protein
MSSRAPRGAAATATGPTRCTALQLLAGRMIAFAAQVYPELGVDVRPVFRAVYVDLFRAPPPPSATADDPLLLGQRSLTVGDALDYMLLVVSNNPFLNADTYKAMYWTTQLLTASRESEARRLQAALETEGFVFSMDVDAAVAKMRIAGRRASLWDRLRHGVDQLCVALAKPPDAVVAGIYNDMIIKCCLPDRPVFTATRGDLRRLVSHYHAKNGYKKQIARYVDKYVGGNRAHMIVVNGDAESVSVRLEDHVANPNDETPLFSSQKACIDCLLRCAQRLVPAAAAITARPWTWHKERYRVLGPTPRAPAPADRAADSAADRAADSAADSAADRAADRAAGLAAGLAALERDPLSYGS